MKERRLAMVRVSPEMLAEMLQGPKNKLFRIIAGTVPLDAELVNYGYSCIRCAFELVFRHESYALVPYGALVPTLAPVYMASEGEDAAGGGFNYVVSPERKALIKDS